MSKAIYMPKGKAGEYAKYACNFYVGCSNDCNYCYCKRGLLGHAMGAPVPTLKKCFKDEEHAVSIFLREMHANIEEYRKHGIFFTFTSDPLLPETKAITYCAIEGAVRNGVPVKILTKRADFINDDMMLRLTSWRNLIAIGFTLTGCDELEPYASANAERIHAMRVLHARGFKTFASIEPVISIGKSRHMIEHTLGFCDLYKIGLLSGHKDYTKYDVMDFIADVNHIICINSYSFPDFEPQIKVYWKDSVLEYIGMNREDLPKGICVGADYNLFA